MAEQVTYLEAAARALCCKGERCQSRQGSCPAEVPFHWSQANARFALATLGMTEAQMQAPVGSLAVVPVEPTKEMLAEAYGLQVGCCTVHDDEALSIWSAMLYAARPGAEGCS